MASGAFTISRQRTIAHPLSLLYPHARSIYAAIPGMRTVTRKIVTVLQKIVCGL